MKKLYCPCAHNGINMPTCANELCLGDAKYCADCAEEEYAAGQFDAIEAICAYVKEEFDDDTAAMIRMYMNAHIASTSRETVLLLAEETKPKGNAS